MSINYSINQMSYVSRTKHLEKKSCTLANDPNAQGVQLDRAHFLPRLQGLNFVIFPNKSRFKELTVVNFTDVCQCLEFPKIPLIIAV